MTLRSNDEEDAMAVTNETAGGTRLDRVVVPQRGASTVAGGRGSITLRALDDGSVRVEPDLDAGFMLLRVDEPTELHDGDVLRAGRLWLSFRAGRGGRPGRLHLLDAKGRTRLGITLRGSALSLGREAGDVILPWDDLLAELHLQVLVRRDGTFVQDLATKSGTWVVVRPGEVLPSGSVIAIDGRLLRVSTPPPRSRRIDRDGPTKVFVAA
jgi:hypothetical protein